ncbi:hypothetical protein C8J56DRAFT_1168043 [Mycena floridula]|nr:hypothetical protein C8J56DRAFT_1168043 [Mycena floridula]
MTFDWTTAVDWHTIDWHVIEWRYYLLAVASLVALLSSYQPRKQQKPSSQLELFQALSTIVIPSKGTWTASVAVNSLLIRTGRNVKISLSSLIAGICSGKLELRDPYNDLAQLVQGQLQVYSWNFSLDLDWSWPKWLSVSIWLMGRRCSKSKPQIPILSNFDQVLSLDTEQEIPDFVSKLSPNAPAAIEFTLLSPNITPSLQNTCFVLSIMPFLPNSHGASRSPSPFQLTLHGILDLLSTNHSEVSIAAIHNVTATYADLLHTAHDGILQDRETRTRIIEQNGVSAWREQRFMLVWEAALMTAGYLNRWVIVLNK